MNRLHGMIASLVVGLVLVANGQTTHTPESTADSHFAAGFDKQTQGDLSASQADARQLYTEAIAEYQTAGQRQPDHDRAQLYWAVCLAQLAVLDPDRAPQYLIDANQRFAAAADCPGADHAVFEQWANLLLGNMLALVEDPADRIVLLRKAADVCQRGLALTREPGPRAQLVQHLGQALRAQAELTADPAERQSLLRQADDHLRAAGAAIAAQQRCQAGLATQNAADLAATPADARRLYRAAITQYQTAAAAQPGHYESQLCWATCLVHLLSLTDDAGERPRLLTAADQRFAIASRCPGPNHVVFDQWAALILNNLPDLAPDPTQRVGRVRQAVALAERGLAVATEPTPRAKMQFRLGDALMQLTATEPDPGCQRALLERAVDQLRAASRSVTVRQLLYEVNYLGIALLSLGRFTRNPALLREAVDELESALKFYPNQYDTHFNLAATWSLLGDAEQAAQHLAVAIDHDPDGAYSRQAAADPDLAPVRGTAAYAAALDRRRRQAAEANGLALLEQARRSRQQAETTNDLPAAALLWTQVLTLGEQAIRFTPDQFTAHLLCATALEQLSQSTANYPALQRRHLDAARQRFAAAARCPGADAAFYDQWSTFLLDRYHPLLGDPAERQQLLTEARQVLEDGIARARFSGIRSRLESRLGSCLVQLARQEPAPANATALYTRALRHFEATTATDQPPQTPRVNELWGWALLRTGQADREKMQIRRGIEQFLRALELQPDNAAAEYGLACAYGQLRQFDQALRHLERSLHNDPQGLFQRRAEQDVDLRALRQTEGFARLFRPRPPLDTITRPTISVK